MSYLQENLYTKVPLKFDKDGKFKILMFSDTHGHNEATLNAIESVVGNVNPDLILVGGDTVHHITDESDKPLIDKVYDFLSDLAVIFEKRNIPWAHVFGNHDNNIGMDNKEQQPAYERFDLNVAKSGPEDIQGVANYVLPIKAHDSDEIKFNVWGLDSHCGLSQFSQYCNNPEINKDVHKLPIGFTDDTSYPPIFFDQIMWYWNSSVELEKHNGKKIPGLMYFHVPLPEFWLAAKNPTETNLEGYCGEAIGNSRMNSGLFATILQRGDVKTVCCGHDHDCNFAAKYCGVTLCYDGALSYNGYNRYSIRGGRVFEIDENDPWNIKTYNVLYKDISDDPMAMVNYYD